MAARGRRKFVPRAGFQAQNEQHEGVHPTMLKQARQSGHLNLSNRSLKTVPNEVWRINIDVPEEARHITLDNTEDRWWEQVDLTKLILASNQLTSISGDIKQLPALTVLDIHDNQLADLPEEICGLSNLTNLSLSHNKLTALPARFGELRQLITLQLQHNLLTDLSDWLGSMVYLNELDVSNNCLTALPESVGEMTKLFKLNISYNKIKVLPHGCGYMPNLHILDATHNSLHTIPDSLGQLRQLEQLYLGHNNLTQLPVLTDCSRLKELHVGNNSIQHLTPSHLEAMTFINVLDIRDNKVKELPTEITVLQQLERLVLANNDLAKLPYELGTLQNLKAIVLDGNPLKSIRRDIIMRGTNELKKYLRSRMEEAPPVEQKAVKSGGGSTGIIGGGGDTIDPFTVSNTKSVTYSEKKASEIPADIWSLMSETEITTVNFSKNALTAWPSNLTLAANSLINLNLGFNKLSSLSPDAGLFLQLTVLDLRNNMLTDLPQEMSSMQRLRDLTISVNRFRDIPAVVYEMGNLENLLVSDNQVSKVHVPGLLKLTKLATLDFSNNDIMQVPPELGKCTSLRSLQLGGNPFRQPRPAVLAKGTPALLEYLRDRIPT